MDPDWTLGGWGHSWHHGVHLFLILDLYANYQLSSKNKSMSRTTSLQSPCWRRFIVPDGKSVILGSPLYVIFLSSVLITSSLALIKMCQEQPMLVVILEGSWWFLDEGLEDWVIFGILYHSGLPLGSFPESLGEVWLELAEILWIRKLRLAWHRRRRDGEDESLFVMV